MKFHLVLYLILAMLSGCSPVNLAKFNKPSVVLSKISVKSEKEKFIKEYEINDKEIFKEIEETSSYRLNKTLEIRNRIIDSLNIPLDRLTVIDYSSHDVAGNYEINYFFYNNDTYIKHFSRANPKITREKIDELKAINPNLFEIYTVMNSNQNEKLTLKPGDGPIRAYTITKMVDNKAELYLINSLDYKIMRLVEKKLK